MLNDMKQSNKADNPRRQPGKLEYASKQITKRGFLKGRIEWEGDHPKSMTAVVQSNAWHENKTSEGEDSTPRLPARLRKDPQMTVLFCIQLKNELSSLLQNSATIKSSFTTGH